MNELLRFSAKGTNGVSAFLPPKYDFVFYETKLEMIRKGKTERTIEYSDITEVIVFLMKRILLPLVCLVLSLVVSGCSFGERNNAADRKKVQFVTELAEICLEHYESGDCELNQIIKPYQIQRWCDPEDYLYNYIEDNSDSFIMAVIMDEDTVVVNTDCLFQAFMAI